MVEEEGRAGERAERKGERDRARTRGRPRGMEEIHRRQLAVVFSFFFFSLSLR